MKHLLTPIAAAVLLAVGNTANAQAPAAPAAGGIVATAPGKAAAAEVVKIEATVAAIDKATRAITLKGPKGNELSVVAGPEVKNFDQLKVGDQVTLEYIEALSLELKKGGGAPVARTEKAGAVAAKPGEKPAGAVGRQVTVVADVVDVNAEKKVVTLKGPQRTVELKVRDPEQLKLIKKGDQVEATFTEAMAIVVTPAAKPAAKPADAPKK
jgi:Cu/Ag efflux protein CusF